tara:strand:+ start:599 stop:919 length:321 start_codon:yes stop_codon:yes gene_type:complete
VLAVHAARPPAKTALLIAVSPFPALELLAFVVVDVEDGLGLKQEIGSYQKVLQVLIYLWEALLPYMAARRQYSLPVRAEEADREQGRLLVISGRVDEACRAAIKGE